MATQSPTLITDTPAFSLARVAAGLLGFVVLIALFALSIQDEIPLGTLSGVATMKESGAPLPNTLLRVEPAFVLAEQVFHHRTIRTEADGSFRLRNLPVGTYNLEASSRAHELVQTKVTITEGADNHLALALPPKPPELTLYLSQHVFTPAEQPELRLEGFGPEPTLTLEVFAIHFEDVLRKNGLPDLYYDELTTGEYRWSGDRKFQPDSPALTRVTQLEHPIANRDPEGVFIDTITLPALEPGLYWVRALGHGLDRGGYLQISDIGLITKHNGAELLAWVTTLDGGTPVANAEVFARNTDGTTRLGTTDVDGLLEAPFPSGAEEGRVSIYAISGTSRAAVGLWTWADESAAGITERVRTFVYTDRPIYRPGDTIQFRGLVRRIEDSGYQLPRSTMAHIELRDPQDNLIEEHDLPLAGLGTFQGSFRTNSEAPTGGYELRMVIGGSAHSEWISLAAYRKPEYSVTVTPKQSWVVDGDMVEFTVAAEYYFGGPVPGATVQAWVSRSPIWRGYWEGEDYEYGGGGGEFVLDLEGTTDGNGVATFRFPATRDPSDGEESWYGSSEQDYRYTITASVADAGGKYYDGTGSVLVTRGAFDLTGEVGRYVASPGEVIPLAITAHPHGEEPVPGSIPVSVSWGFEEWGENPDTGHWESTLETLGSRDLTLTNGQGTLELTAPRAGYLTIAVSVKDRQGHTIRSESWVYITDGSAHHYGRQTGELFLQLDKKQYAVGEVAELLITASRPGATALLTVEGEDIYHRQLVSLSEASSVITLPIATQFAPNAEISLGMVSEKEFHFTTTRLNVDLTQRQLTIDIAADKATYLPGETVTYTIATKNAVGQPVEAEVSLGVVDESIYAIREDTADPLAAFYPRRWNQFSTYWSFAPIYLDGGDKGELDTDIRTKFLDTAEWVPRVNTGPSGLTTVQVTLPDNLTQWRATVTGITADSLVGKATQKIRVRKELMVRLEAPRFYTQGDLSEVVGVFHNDTAAPLPVQVHLGLEGATLREGKADLTLTLKPGEPTKVTWPLSFSEPGTVAILIQAKAQTGPLNDGIRMSVPVLPHGRTLTQREAGEFADSTTLEFELDPAAIPTVGALRVTLAPTLAASLLTSLDYLAGYPYGCTEQTMSRFLPTVMVAQVLRQLDLDEPALAAQLPDMVAKGYARLGRFQHEDGGWGWWEYDTSDPWMTAYVLEGYARATEAGYEPNEFSRQQGIGWARNFIANPPEETDRWRRGGGNLFLLRALALNGETAFVKEQMTHRRYTDLTTSGQLASGLLIADALDDQAMVELLTARLVSAATTNTAGLVSWEEDYWGVETTAQALLALVTVAPEHPLIPGIVRGLEFRRQGDHWYSTRDTAIVVAALSRYLAATGALDADYAVAVALNGTPRDTIAVSRATLASQDYTIDIPLTELRPGTNRVTLTKSEGAPCFWSSAFRQVVHAEVLSPEPLGAELTISRAYYKLEVRKDADGALRLIPGEKPVTSFKPGDLLRCRLTITSTAEREFLMITDPFPAGIECVERAEPEDPWSWYNWWSNTDIRDDRIIFFARHLGEGTQEIAYTLRAETPGTISALPSVIESMYDPAQVASGAGQSLEVRP